MKNEAKSVSVKKLSQAKHARVGIYAGTFDPVHAGHVAFALQALHTAQLDVLFFLPERQPRHKKSATHYAHRVAMLRRAARPYAKVQVMEMVDKSFSVAHTLPRLQALFPAATLVYVCGSDTLLHMPKWNHIAVLLASTELCVGRRHTETVADIKKKLLALPCQPQHVYSVEAILPAMSSSQIRHALQSAGSIAGILASVKAYARQEWLYI